LILALFKRMDRSRSCTGHIILCTQFRSRRFMICASSFIGRGIRATLTPNRILIGGGVCSHSAGGSVGVNDFFFGKSRIWSAQTRRAEPPPYPLSAPGSDVSKLTHQTCKFFSDACAGDPRHRMESWPVPPRLQLSSCSWPRPGIRRSN
jgi:hypothetical protein